MEYNFYSCNYCSNSYNVYNKNDKGDVTQYLIIKQQGVYMKRIVEKITKLLSAHQKVVSIADSIILGENYDSDLVSEYKAARIDLTILKRNLK